VLSLEERTYFRILHALAYAVRGYSK